jgi:hypothetical protein
MALAALFGIGSGCRAPCNLDMDQPLCVTRFQASDMLIYRVEPEDERRRGGAQLVTRARGDLLLGADWVFATRGEQLVVGFPDAGAVGVLPSFRREESCLPSARRTLSFVPDITVQRQPRLIVQANGCPTNNQVMFTGPADFGRSLLSWYDSGSARWDLWVAAPSEGLYRGTVYGFLGSSGRPGALRNHDAADVVISGISPGDRLGMVLERCPSPTGEGSDLIAVGIPGWAPVGDEGAQFGAVALFRADTSVGRDLTPADAITFLEGSQPGDRAGLAIACGLDIDGDGLPEVVVGAPGHDRDQPQGGAVYVLSGPLPANGTLADAAAWTLVGREPYEELGRSISVDDFDEDGLDDLVVGAPGAGPPTDPTAGAVHVFLGTDLITGAATRTTFRGQPSGSPPASGRLGTQVFTGDITGDGTVSIVTGAWRLSQDARVHAGEIRMWPFSTDRIGDVVGADEAVALRGEGSHQQVGRRMVLADITGDGRLEVVSAIRRRTR